MAALATTGVLATPALAQANWRSQLQQAFCSQNWPEAIGLTSTILGNDVSAEERRWLLALRQDLYAYQRREAAFPGCSQGMVAGATPAGAQILQVGANTGWDRVSTAVGNIPTGTARPSVAGTTRTPSPSRATRTPTSNVGQRQAATPETCPGSASDRRVANGTVSNRWVYEIWQQGSGNSFQTRYWRQSETCHSARRTLSYATQNESYQEFLRYATDNESVGTMQRRETY